MEGTRGGKEDGWGGEGVRVKVDVERARELDKRARSKMDLVGW